jgi:hypothetical protein
MTKPVHVEAYPLLYNHRSLINDYLLREVIELLRRKGADDHLSSFTNWTPDAAEINGALIDEGGGVLLNLADQPVQHVGGMLLAASKDFLFDASPFILKRHRDVRCRFGYGQEPSADFGQDGDASPMASDTLAQASDELMASRSPKYQYDSDRGRLYFQLQEYVGVGDESCDWVVQTLQLIGRTGANGKVVYRAHLTAAGASKLRFARDVAASPLKPPASPLEMDLVVPTTRMPVHGEDHLKESNPELLEWCLKRDPVEMGAAARVIRNVVEYYRFSFTVIRTVKSLLRSIRKMQRFARKLLANRVSAELRLMRDWFRLEQELKQRLVDHRSLPGDDVDRIVNKVLLKHCITSADYKRSVIRSIWEDRKSRYRTEREIGGAKAALEAFTLRFSWYIDPQELMSFSQRSLVDLLSSNTNEGVFRHPLVKSLFIDDVDETDIVRRAVAEATDQRLSALEGRRIPAFGSTSSRFAVGPERSLDIHVERQVSQGGTEQDGPQLDDTETPSDLSTM